MNQVVPGTAMRTTVSSMAARFTAITAGADSR
jgi:hypothetical protein